MKMIKLSWKLTVALLSTGVLSAGAIWLLPAKVKQIELHPAKFAVKPSVQGPTQPAKPAPSPVTDDPKLHNQRAQLIVQVIDGRTRLPLDGAEVVVIETKQRVRTGKDGSTPVILTPVIREERYSRLVAQLHGQLGLIAYKNGYRDAITFGVRMHEGLVTRITMWMYKIDRGPDRDRRIEPTLYQVPFHHLWLVQLADEFRSSSQPGEGPESPDQ